MNTMLDKVRDEIVLALGKQAKGATAREINVGPKEAPRLPVRVENRDLDSAVDDMIDRFPKTLDYLAK
jgi:hypothetical protein